MRISVTIFFFGLSLITGAFYPVMLKAQTSLFIAGSKSVYIKSTTLSAKGHVTNNGTLSGTTSGILNLNGTATQNLNGSAVNTTTIGKININNTNGASLGTNVDLTGTTGLDFVQGPITLNGSNIRFASGSSWTNNNTSTKFFITNGIGRVYAQNSGAAVMYPVGIATGASNYTPITITNAGTPDSYGIRVQSGFRTNYNSTDGAPMGSLITSNVVNVSWIVNEAVLGGSSLTTQVQWNAANETSGFVRSSSMVGYYRYALANWLVGTIGSVVTTAGGAFTKSFSAPTITTFSFLPIVVGNSLSPLPIELLDFHVIRKDKDALLEWSTASEINNDHFEIERSFDAQTFLKIGTEKGAGNSTQLTDYDYTDAGVGNSISSGIIYYRLKQVDFDGKFSYSGIQSISFEADGAMVIYPNPTKGELTINFTSAAEYEMAVRVIDILGAIVKETKVTVNSGNQDIHMDLNELANGHYKLMLIAPTGIVTHKIIVSK